MDESAATEVTRRAVPAALREVRETMHASLAGAVGTLQRDLARMCGYSFGWCEVDGTPAGAPTGKMVRPTLALLSAEAAGAAAATALPGAMAVELAHLFSLVHDDIMDGDETRRHRPTVWKAYGTGPAVLAGDALYALAVETLAEAGGPAAARAVRALSRAVTGLINGQAQDLAFEARPWTGTGAVTAAEYQAMTADKTAGLLGCAAGIGAILAAAPTGAVAGLTAYGHHLGLAFQAVDDLLGLRGDPARTGKPVHADLARRKKTLPIVAALSTETPAARELAALLAGHSDPDLVRAADLVDAAGGSRFAEAFARHQHDLALRALRAAEGIEPAAAEELATLSNRLLDRQD